MEITALYAGSFDPVTKGHEHIARRAAKLFGKLLVAVGDNSEKQAFFPLEKRMKWLRETFRDVKNIEVVSYQGLTVDACRRYGASVLVRGLRSAADWEAERDVAYANRYLAPDIETLLLPADTAFSPFSSTLVRELLRYGKDVSAMLPEAVRPEELSAI